MAKAKAVTSEAPAVELAGQMGEQEAPVVEVAEQSEHQTEARSSEAPEAHTVIKCRVLSQCAYGEPNEVVELSAAEAKTAGGLVDADPAAVAYAESLAGK